MANLLYGSENFSTTLNVPGGINNSQTSGIVLTSVTGLNTNGGILCFDWASTLDTSVAEYIEYGGISSNTLTGVVRASEGLSAKAHANGATVVAVVSQAHLNRINDKLRNADTTLALDQNGNAIINTGSVGSAVNQITVTNAATGNGPQLAATGSDANIDLVLKGQGTGKVRRDASYGTMTTDTDASTVTFDMSVANLHTVVLGGNRTLAVSNVAVGQAFILRLVQDGTGSRTVTWFSTLKWAGGSAPTLTTTASKTDVIGFLCTSSGNYDAFVIGQNL